MGNFYKSVLCLFFQTVRVILGQKVFQKKTVIFDWFHRIYPQVFMTS